MRVLVLPLILVLGLLAAWLLPVVDWLQALIAWIQSHQEISWLLYGLLYVAATVLLLPGSVITLGAGFLFGLGYGFVLVSAASVTGATLAFLIGRFLARDWVESKLQSMPRFSALDRAIQERGWLIVLLTRLSPLFPFNLLNYGLGLTGVRLPTYVLVSWVGMMPGTLLYVYLGSVGSDLTALFSGQVESGELGGWLFYVGLFATAVLTVIITRIATKTLNETLDATGPEKDEGEDSHAAEAEAGGDR